MALKDQQVYDGAAGVGSGDRGSAKIVQGEELVLQVYCPQKLSALDKRRRTACSTRRRQLRAPRETHDAPARVTTDRRAGR